MKENPKPPQISLLDLLGIVTVAGAVFGYCAVRAPTWGRSGSGEFVGDVVLLTTALVILAIGWIISKIPSPP
jgi:hypothetical protein